MYTTEGDADVQLTNGDYQNYSAPANVAGMSGIMELIYPIGSIVTLGVSTNPGTLYGVGTWAQIKGKVIVGIDDSGTFDTLDATGGAETVSVAHTHTVPATSTTAWGAIGTNTNGTLGLGKSASSDSKADSAQTDAPTSAMSANATPSTLQPYQVKYVWERAS